MLFGRKKPKIDPKIRFQNRQFNQKLQQARTFKRTARPIPEGQWSKRLARIGLGSLWKQVFVLAVVGGIIYLVYIPNFLTVQSFQIEGMSEADRERADAAIRTAVDEAPFYDPQRNLLFLSKNRLKRALLNVPSVDSVNNIDIDFKTKAVKISLTSKYERFLVRTSDAVFDVYKDGSLKGAAGIDHSAWPSVRNPAMAKMELNAKVLNRDHKEFFNSRASEYIIALQSELAGITGSTLSHFNIVLPEFRQPIVDPNTQSPDEPSSEASGSATEAMEGDAAEPAEPPAPAPAPILMSASEVQLPITLDELEIVLQKGNNPGKTFEVRIDTKENPHDLVQRLNLLLSQTAPDRYNNLSYIDLRIQSRAFVCLIGAPCNQ